MVYLVEQCILPVMNAQDDVGQGFFANGYFITAAHIVNKWPDCYIYFDDKKIYLSECECILFGEGNVERDCSKLDIAIYKFENAISVLHLSSRKPQTSDMLKSWKANIRMDLETGKYFNRLDAKEAILTGQEEGNYFYCKCNRYDGSSGSPLLIDNEVVGVLHGGDGGNICAFLKTGAFLFPPKASRPSSKYAGYNRTDYDPFGHYNHNTEARRQIGEAYDGDEEARWNSD